MDTFFHNEDTAYFCWISFENETNKPICELYSINIPTKKTEKIMTWDDTSLLPYHANNGLIYFKDPIKYYSMKPDGSEKTEVTRFDSGIFDADDGNVYYTTDYVLYKAKKGGVDPVPLLENVLKFYYYNGYVYFMYPENYDELPPEGIDPYMFYNFCDGELWRISTEIENAEPELYGETGDDIYPDMKFAQFNGKYIFIPGKHRLAEPIDGYEYIPMFVIVNLDTMDIKIYDRHR